MRLLITFVLSFLLALPATKAYSRDKNSKRSQTDREYWAELLYDIAEPVLSNMSRGELIEKMEMEFSPSFDSRNRRVAYMEAFGRLMSGIAPWLALPDDDSAEGIKRKQLRQWALASYANAVDPDSPDCLQWDGEGQVLVDAAYIASSFLRAPNALWEPLDAVTKQRYIEKFQSLRWVDVPYTNWLLFSAMTETFLLSVGAEFDQHRIHMAIRKIDEWYVGDGWYSDGERFSFDYYNSYVIHPMYVQVLQVLVDKNIKLRDKSLDRVRSDLEIAEKRMQRFGEILERLISPEGTFPPFGRSITYRTGVFQPLAMLAWREDLPESLSQGQVRAALTATIRRMFTAEGVFSRGGYLQLGFAGHQPDVADWYTNSGSLYIATEVFLPLGLPADHSFWTVPGQDWTAKKAWEGKPFPRDHAIHQ